MLCGHCSEENADIVVDLLSKVGGLCKYCYEVTPNNQKALTYDEESWKPTPEDSHSKEKSSEAATSSTSSSKSSKTKKVKKYFKKCKNALGSTKSSTSFDCDTVSQISVQSSSCRVDPRLENLLQEGEVEEIEDFSEDALLEPLENKEKIKFAIANIVQVKGPPIFDEKTSTKNKVKDSQNDKEDPAVCFKKDQNIPENGLENVPLNDAESLENFQSAFNSLCSENLKSEDCDFYSLDSKNFVDNETDFKHKQNVIESFSEIRTTDELTKNVNNDDSVIKRALSERNARKVEERETLADNFRDVSSVKFKIKSKDICKNSDFSEKLISLASSERDVNIVSPLLGSSQEKVEDNRNIKPLKNIQTTNDEAQNKPNKSPKNVVKSDMEILMDKYFGHIYHNYSASKKCLIRQARDLLVCEYRGCLNKFENEFCIHAAKLLQHLKE